MWSAARCDERRSPYADSQVDFEAFYTEPALADLEDILAWPWVHEPASPAGINPVPASKSPATRASTGKRVRRPPSQYRGTSFLTQAANGTSFFHLSPPQRIQRG